jgi:hypothetical protein
MRKTIILFTLLALCNFDNASAKSSYFSFLDAVIQLTDSADGAKCLSKPDAYSASFSTFDMNGRFGDQKNHTQKEYLQLAAKQTSAWPEADQKTIREGFANIEMYINRSGLQLFLPDTILFIRSTCNEEFGAGGYTRGNAIVINQKESLPTTLIAHELFHVISRKTPLLRNALYADIGFKKCNPIDVKTPLAGLNITNPDCPVIEHYTTIGNEDVVLILHSKRPYTGGDVFSEYVAVSLMVVEGDANNKKAVLKDGKPVVYNVESKPELFDIIGTNTPYILHPEEICAEHFASLVTNREVRQQEYIDKMKDNLKKH